MLNSSSGDRETLEASIAAISARETARLPPEVGAAVRYALSGGGKRLRGLLLMASYRAAGGGGDVSVLAAAVEIIHAYSLVHDDLPCMDDDDMRRGRLSTHRAFSVPVATAAGAAMIPIAAGAAHRGAAGLRLPGNVCCTIVKALMQAAGAGGMIGGQTLDLAGEGSVLRREELDGIHAAKTGALISVAAGLGGIAAGAAPGGVAALERYGENIGLAFQIMDDVLDVTASSLQLGKTAGRDAKMQKSTYPALLGIDEARERAGALVSEGCSALREQDMLTAELASVAAFIVARSH
jgi:farnesyl diphosphate synthase/geranylgeranyl diphosphate synthase type II